MRRLHQIALVMLAATAAAFPLPGAAQQAARKPVVDPRLERLKAEGWLYLEQRNVPFLSISAMPSVHVAIAVLFALAGREAGRVAGLVLTAYALVVLVGSVHLGWHYAVDGYFAALATGLSWVGCGAALRPWFRVIRHPDPVIR